MQIQSIKTTYHIYSSLKQNQFIIHTPNLKYQQSARTHKHSCGAATAAAKSIQSCPTLCDPVDGSPPGSPVPGILQATTLEWVAISFSNAWKWKVKGKSLSRVRLLATRWATAYQPPASMGFSRREYWSGVPLPSPGMETFLGLIKEWTKIGKLTYCIL